MTNSFMKKPYNAGDYVKYGPKQYMILGHIWWPVEKANAYHCTRVDDYGNITSDKVEYIWDHGNNDFTPWTPKELKVA